MKWPNTTNVVHRSLINRQLVKGFSKEDWEKRKWLNAIDINMDKAKEYLTNNDEERAQLNIRVR